MSVTASTDEARALVAEGVIKPGDAALDRPIDSMTDREVMDEILVHQRQQRDVVTKLIADMMNSPLGAMLKSGANPLTAMFGGGRR